MNQPTDKRVRRKLTPKARAWKRLASALREWDRQWGNVARNDPYAAPWDRRLGEAISNFKKVSEL